MIHDGELALAGLSRLCQLVHAVRVPVQPAELPYLSNRGEAAKVDPNAYGNLPLFGGAHNHLHLLPVPDVAGIQAKSVNARRDGLQSKLVVKVDIGDDRYLDLLHYLSQGVGCLHIGNGRPYDVTPHLLQLLNLAHRGLHVPGVRLGHGLDRNGRIASYGDIANLDGFGNSSRPHLKHASPLNS